MNSSAFASEARFPRSDESMAFLAFGSKKTPANISQSAEGALKNVRTLIEQLLVQAVSVRTLEEFSASRFEVFPKYVDYLMAYGNIVRASLTLGAVKQLNYESLLDLEAHFRNSGMEAFGKGIKDQAIFAAWALRQVNELVGKCATENVGDRLRVEDRDLAVRFSLQAFQAHFSLDCLLIAMTKNIAVFPEVLADISQGLRAVANAYAFARQGHKLRCEGDTRLIQPIEWDEEDEILLAASEPTLER